MVDKGFKVAVEAGAGLLAKFPDSAYINAGATIVPSDKVGCCGATGRVGAFEPNLLHPSRLSPYPFTPRLFFFSFALRSSANHTAASCRGSLRCASVTRAWRSSVVAVTGRAVGGVSCEVNRYESSRLPLE